MQLNKWKFNSFDTRDFEKFKIDEFILYKKDPKPEFLIKLPFRIPKKDGDLFANY